VHFVFGAQTLDDTNWVVDFGGLKPIKIWLEQNFDHKLLVAEDDPFKGTICNLMLTDIADVRIVKATGMEMVAKEIFDHVDAWLKENYSERVSLESVEVCEHEGNSARVLR
jgi:6-pyruvoyltetrahydropterin/6-carboxytetrahydropterin synthase